MPNEPRLVIWGPGIKVQAILLLILTAVCGAVAIFAIKDGKSGYSVLFGLLVLVFLIGTVRSFQTRVVATPAGLEVHRTIGSVVEVVWGDVERFDYRGWGGGLALRRKNGRWVKLQDFGRWRSSAQKAVAELESFRDTLL